MDIVYIDEEGNSSEATQPVHRLPSQSFEVLHPSQYEHLLRPQVQHRAKSYMPNIDVRIRCNCGAMYLPSKKKHCKKKL